MTTWVYTFTDWHEGLLWYIMGIFVKYFIKFISRCIINLYFLEGRVLH